MRFRVHIAVLLVSALTVALLAQYIHRQFTRVETNLYYDVRLLDGAVDSVQVIIEGRPGLDQMYLVLVPSRTAGANPPIVELRTPHESGFRWMEEHTMSRSAVTVLPRDGAYDVWQLQAYRDGSDTIRAAFVGPIFGPAREADVSIRVDFANFSVPAEILMRQGEGVTLSYFEPLPDHDRGRWLSYSFPAVADGEGIRVQFTALDSESAGRRDFQIFICGILIGVMTSLATTALWDMLVAAGRFRRDA